MKITCLRQMEYENTYIYLMQFDMTFQYLYSWKNQIYMDRIEVKPPLWKQMLWRMGLIKNLYDNDQISEAETIILNGAMGSLNILKGKKSQSKSK